MQIIMINYNLGLNYNGVVQLWMKWKYLRKIKVTKLGVVLSKFTYFHSPIKKRSTVNYKYAGIYVMQALK